MKINTPIDVNHLFYYEQPLSLGIKITFMNRLINNNDALNNEAIMKMLIVLLAFILSYKSLKVFVEFILLKLYDIFIQHKVF